MPTLRNISAGRDLSNAVARMRSPLARAVGWLGASHIAADEGKWFDRCRAIHTIGMRSALDIIFLDRDGRVLEMYPRVTPQRFCVAHPSAAALIEMGPGFLDRQTVARGDILALIDPAPRAPLADPAR